MRTALAYAYSVITLNVASANFETVLTVTMTTLRVERAKDRRTKGFSPSSPLIAACRVHMRDTYIGTRVPRTRACCIHIPESLRITEAVANGRTVSRFSSERAAPTGRFAPAHPHSGGLGPIGTHIGILLPGLRPVIARFSAISHSRLCAPSSHVATLRRADGERPGARISRASDPSLRPRIN